jgi:SP family general alpha glucoside:H+ symporter-like MFS transporter
MEKTTETTMIENTTFNVGVEEELREAEAKGKLDEINRDMAKRGTATEHKMGSWEAMKVYRRGAFWSMFISLSIIMRAYDIEIMGNFYALPAFQQHFGIFYKGHGYQIPAAWVTISISSSKGQG